MSLPPPDFRAHVFAHPHERRQFEFFNALNHPHFGLVARVDVTHWAAVAKTRGVRFNHLVVHAVTRAANAVPELRRRVRGATVVEHNTVHPSYSVPTDVAAGFSFCTVPYVEDLGALLSRSYGFAKTAAATETALRTAPSFSDAPDRDDYLFLSAIPWVHFTGIQHAMGYHPHDSVPRISWGKVVEEGGTKWMPVSVQAHHAVADGRALGAFYEGLERAL